MNMPRFTGADSDSDSSLTQYSDSFFSDTPKKISTHTHSKPVKPSFQCDDPEINAQIQLIKKRYGLNVAIRHTPGAVIAYIREKIKPLDQQLAETLNQQADGDDLIIHIKTEELVGKKSLTPKERILNAKQQKTYDAEMKKIDDRVSLIQAKLDDLLHLKTLLLQKYDIKDTELPIEDRDRPIDEQTRIRKELGLPAPKKPRRKKGTEP